MKENEITLKEPGAYVWGWVQVFVGFMLLAVGMMAAYTANSLFTKPVSEALGVGRSQFALYITISNLVTGIVAPTWGKLMKKTGVKWINLAGIVLLGLSFIAKSFATNVIHFYIIAIFRGAGYGAATNLAINVLMDNWFGVKKKGLALGIATAGVSVGGKVFLPMVSGTISNSGWQAGYRLLGAMILCILIPLVLILECNAPAQKGLKRYGEADADAKAAIPVLKGLTLQEAQRKPVFWLMLAAVFLMCVANGVISNHATAHLLDIGYESAAAASILANATLAVTAGKIILGWLGDKTNATVSLTVGMVGLILAILALLMAPVLGSAFAVVYIVTYCFGMAVTMVCYNLMVSGIFGRKDFARIYGYTMTALALGNAVGPTLGGVLFDIAGNYSIAWVVCAIFCVISTVIFLLAGRISYADAE